MHKEEKWFPLDSLCHRTSSATLKSRPPQGCPWACCNSDSLVPPPLWGFRCLFFSHRNVQA